MEENKWFPLAGIRLFFKNWTFLWFPLAGKSSLNKTMFQIVRKSDSTSRNGEFV